MNYFSVHSPLGDLTLFEDDDKLISLDWGRVEEGCESPLMLEAARQLEEYFDGDRESFDLPLSPHGTTFQKKVWDAMKATPYGQAATYGQIAQALQSSPRAVGMACGRNPLPILIPCHRVVGSNGSLGGYSGLDGVATKRILLSLEGYPDSK